RELLPSFIYLPPSHEDLGPFVVGAHARDRGAQVPGRLVSSSKSWLSHPGVDRRSQLLPPAADPETPRISPLEAAARILGQIREGWEAAHAQEGASLADQAVTLTVPASFDAAARDLTVQAAAQAGLAKLTLLEEPQAALYAWVEAAGDEWRRHVRPGDVILDVEVDATPLTQRRVGLATLGLPYAQDPAVTRHLAAFLRRSSGALAKRPGATFLHPTALLFNGGVFKDASLQKTLASLVDRWVRAEGGAAIKVLRSA